MELLDTGPQNTSGIPYPRRATMFAKSGDLVSGLTS